MLKEQLEILLLNLNNVNIVKLFFYTDCEWLTSVVRGELVSVCVKHLYFACYGVFFV